MKRIAVLFLVLSLLLSGCSLLPLPTAPTEPTKNTDPTDPTSVTDPTQPTDPTNPTDPVVYNRHPLTGAVLDQPWSGQNTAVLIDNLRDAAPQCGISKADILYEVEAESGITRFLAVYSDIAKAGVVGPVHSTRTAFNSIAVAYDAPLIHCGGSAFALDAMYDDSEDRIKNWEHIDEMANAAYFYRDVHRQNQGYAYEHTLFSTGSLIAQAMRENGLNTPSGNNFGLQFHESKLPAGKSATEVKITFKGSKTSLFRYDAATCTYKMTQYDKEVIDGNTNKAVEFKNVLAIYTDQRRASDNVHMFYDTVGSGEGYLAVNGQIIPILWSRESLRSPFIYTLGNGTPLTLAVGNTYVAMVGTRHPISYQ